MCADAQEKIEKMLASEPQKVSDGCLAKWKYLGPLTIKEIGNKGSKADLCFDVTQVMYMEFPAKKPHTGQGDIVEDFKQGICRCVSAPGGIFEGQFMRGKKHGFAREIFADGGYMIASY